MVIAQTQYSFQHAEVCLQDCHPLRSLRNRAKDRSFTCLGRAEPSFESRTLRDRGRQPTGV
jgi:hypothetical protein